jgi:tetratricopeptide (TPR) repeat protein
MVLIGRDEVKNIGPCFRSFWHDVDEIVYVDTGSQDDTVKEAVALSLDYGEPDKLVLGEFEWCDDFAAARNYATSLAAGEWICWADLDDSVEGAEHLRELARNAPPEVTALMFEYDYAQDERGQCICTLKRERLVRAGHVEWEGRVHEAQKITGQAQMVPPDRVIWRHRKKPGDTPTDRNLRILEKWAVEEPSNGRVVQYLGTERAGQGQHERAVEAYEQYLALPSEPAEHRAQVRYKAACSLLALDRVDGAFEHGLRGIGELPQWPDSYLTLARCAHLQGRHDSAVLWARQVLELGQPQTLLIVNPQDYTVEARVPLAASLAALGRLDEACQEAERALAIRPDHPLLAGGYREWLGLRKRAKAAETWLNCARLLVAHDEQQKALDLLEGTPPYFVQDAPGIVKLRSELRERLAFASDPGLYAEHYETGGSKPEDMVADENVVRLCERLPRAQFLARQIEELLEAAA